LTKRKEGTTTTPLEEGRNEILLNYWKRNLTILDKCAKTNLAMDMAIDINIKKEDLKPEEIVT